MEENIQEPIYLNYGSSQIDLLAFLNAAANNVLTYLQQLPWSNKRKELFMKAYSDIMSKGVIGADNSTGMWQIEYNGNINLDSKSKKEREMYGEAAYFIQLQMNSLTSIVKTEDKTQNLPLFDNKIFNSGLDEYIANTYYRGMDFDRNTMWNSIDEANEFGIRGTQKRANRLAEVLENYANSIDSTKYNFKDSPYLDITVLRKDLLLAAEKLRNGTWDNETLYRIGLDPEKYLSTGENEQVIYGDRTYTRKQLMDIYNKLLNSNPVQQVINNSEESLLPEETQENKGYVSRQLIGGNDDIKWETEDVSRMIAALGDIVALGGFWANVGGSTVSLVADTTADIADENLTGWDVVKNLGRNLGWTAAGFIPGGKLGKVGKNIVRWAPKLLVVLNDYNLLNDKSNKETWDKLTNTDRLKSEGLNSEDLKNVTYWVRAITGTTNAAKSVGRDIKYSKARGTSGQEFTTKSGKKVLLSNNDVDEINATGARKGQKAAEELFRTKTGEDIADGQMLFLQEGTRKWFANTRSRFTDLRLSGKSTVFRTPEQLRYFDLYNRDRGASSWRGFWRKGVSSYWDHFNSSNSFDMNKLTNEFNPYRTEVNTSTTTKPASKPTTSSETTPKPSSSNTIEHISPKDFGLPKNVNFDAYVKNATTNRHKRGTSKRFIDKNLDYNAKVDLGGGNTLDVNVNKSGELVIKDKSGTVLTRKKLSDDNYSYDAKKIVGETINRHRLSLMNSGKIKRSYTKEFILSILNLKKQGLLFKQGGIISQEDNLQYIILNFLNKLK